MAYQITTALKKILKLRKRLKIIQGGTSAGKTIAIMLYLIDKMQNRKGITITVVSESVPHLKRGAIKDFRSILMSHNMWDADCWNGTDRTYRDKKSGSVIEFVSGDRPEQFTGPRREVLYINEANSVPYSVYEQAEMRTSEEVIVDFNPVSDFWLQEQVIPHTDHDFIILTYLDNEGLPASIRQSIESKKHNDNWWRVYGLGQTGIREGLIYQNFKPIDKVPTDAQLIRYALDFGFTNDPTAIIGIYKWNGAYIVDEERYDTGMSNRQIYNSLSSMNGTTVLTIADSSEPKSIAEIASYTENGKVKIIGATKGQDSVDHGISLLQDLEIYYTERSYNIRKEVLNYMWRINKHTGKPMNEPIDDYNHALDAIRYAITDVATHKPLLAKNLIYM